MDSYKNVEESVRITEKSTVELNPTTDDYIPKSEPFFAVCGLCKKDGRYITREFTDREEFYAHRHF